MTKNIFRAILNQVREKEKDTTSRRGIFIIWPKERKQYQKRANLSNQIVILDDMPKKKEQKEVCTLCIDTLMQEMLEINV